MLHLQVLVSQTTVQDSQALDEVLDKHYQHRLHTNVLLYTSECKRCCTPAREFLTAVTGGIDPFVKPQEVNPQGQGGSNQQGFRGGRYRRTQPVGHVVQQSQ